MTAHKHHRERKLPVQQLSILAVCRFAEPIATTSLFPYLPEMVKSFGIPEAEVGKWAGICSAIFSICQAIAGVPWGRFSDVYGRKPAILFGLFSTMVTSLMWGFSTSLPMAIVARALQGFGNGNVGIIRTTVAEMVPFKELQPRAFSLMPLVWNVGSIFGPTIGGALANPYNVEPEDHIKNGSLFQRFPYALPNIVSACFFAVGITTGIFFLEETLETLHGRRDYGLRLGDQFTRFTSRCLKRLLETLRLRNPPPAAEREREPLLKPTNGNEESGEAMPPPGPAAPAPGFREVLTKQSFLNLIVYTLLAMHTMAFDQLLPVYMQFPSLHSGSPDITPPFTDGNPLKFAGGFSLDHFRIGMLSTSYGVVGMLIQFFIFPPVARRFGILFCLKVCVLLFPVCYFIMPFTALLPTQRLQIVGGFAVMLLKCILGIFAYPSSTILITNSASSLRVLGTLNGFATSAAAVGRAAGPALGGTVFTLGVKNGYVIAPFWLFTAISILAAVPVFWLVEGDGFGGDADEVDDSDEEEEEEILTAQAIEGEAEAAGKPGPVLVPSTQEAHEEEEEAYGGVGTLLSRTNTASSAAMDSDSGSIRGTQDGAQATGTSSSSRRGSRARRRMSLPLGMGNQGISRKYSSNLGQSFGSAGSYHGQ